MGGVHFVLMRTLTRGEVQDRRFERAFPIGSAFIAPLLIFTLAVGVLAQPGLVPHPPFTQMPFVSLPMAALAVAFIHRPLIEHPVYAAVYLVLRLQFAEAAQWPFILPLTIIEVVQTSVYVWVMWRFYPRFTEPLWASIWPVAVVAVTAFGALPIVQAGVAFPSSLAYAREFWTDPWLAWRHVWLGNAVSYLALAGPAAILIGFRRRFRESIWNRPSERHAFFGLSALLLALAVISYPVVDASGLKLPADIRLSMALLPAPVALVMASKFRANGASAAMLILAPVMILSLCGPYAAANWNDLPITTTPAHALLLMTTTAAMVLAVVSRQLRLALIQANEAAAVKSRFIAMLNHELRTPLNAILGFTELMRLKQLRELDEAMGSIENIHASGQRLLAMIEGLLSATDHGAGVFSLEKQRIEAGGFLVELVDEMSGEFDPLGVSVDIAAAADLTIDADPRALKQMLHVLLTFSLRFVGPDTAIHVSADHVGTDTVIEVNSRGLINAAADDRDKLEVQLVDALALAHGARLRIVETTRISRVARLTFFATRAAG
jgi:signal transduction histidine kinase